MNRFGFSTLLLTLFFATLAVSVTGGSYLFLNPSKNPFSQKSAIPKESSVDTKLPIISQTPEISQTITKITPTKTPTPTPKPKVTVTPTPQPKVKFTFHLFEATTKSCGGYTCIGAYDGNEPPLKSSQSVKLKLINSKTNQVWEKSATSEWSVEGLIPGSYKATAEYSSPYIGYTSNCNNCENQQPISTTGLCGYTFDLVSGKDAKMSCGVSNPSDIQPDTSDHNPPSWSVYYPASNGSITYKTDGKVCVYMNAPSDDRTGEISGRVGFDGNWQDWKAAGSYGYACMDSLSNGSHTFTYQAKDLAGNEQSVQTMSFTVNIPGN